MHIIIALVIGIVAGAIITRIIFKKSAIGSLRVDNSDPDSGPLLFLEVYEGKSDFAKYRQVVLDVKAEDYISQEKHSL